MSHVRRASAKTARAADGARDDGPRERRQGRRRGAVGGGRGLGRDLPEAETRAPPRGIEPVEEEKGRRERDERGEERRQARRHLPVRPLEAGPGHARERLVRDDESRRDADGPGHRPLGAPVQRRHPDRVHAGHVHDAAAGIPRVEAAREDHEEEEPDHVPAARAQAGRHVEEHRHARRDDDGGHDVERPAPQELGGVKRPDSPARERHERGADREARERAEVEEMRGGFPGEIRRVGERGRGQDRADPAPLVAADRPGDEVEADERRPERADHRGGPREIARGVLRGETPAVRPSSTGEDVARPVGSGIQSTAPAPRRSAAKSVAGERSRMRVSTAACAPTAARNAAHAARAPSSVERGTRPRESARRPAPPRGPRRRRRTSRGHRRRGARGPRPAPPSGRTRRTRPAPRP